MAKRWGQFKLEFQTYALIGDLTAAISKAFKDVAPHIRRAIKRVTPVDTGRLKRSIQVRAIRGRNARLEIKTVYYGRFVEMGTVRMAPRGFIHSVIIGRRKYWSRRVLLRSKRYLRTQRRR